MENENIKSSLENSTEQVKLLNKDNNIEEEEDQNPENIIINIEEYLVNQNKQKEMLSRDVYGSFQPNLSNMTNTKKLIKLQNKYSKIKKEIDVEPTAYNILKKGNDLLKSEYPEEFMFYTNLSLLIRNLKVNKFSNRIYAYVINSYGYLLMKNLVQLRIIAEKFDTLFNNKFKSENFQYEHLFKVYYRYAKILMENGIIDLAKIYARKSQDNFSKLNKYSNSALNDITDLMNSLKDIDENYEIEKYKILDNDLNKYTKNFDLEILNLCKKYINNYWIEHSNLLFYLSDKFIWQNLDTISHYDFSKYKKENNLIDIKLLILNNSFIEGRFPFMKFRYLEIKEKISTDDFTKVINNVIHYEIGEDSVISYVNVKLYKFITNENEKMKRKETTFNIVYNYIKKMKKLIISNKILEEIKLESKNEITFLNDHRYILIIGSKYNDFQIEIQDPIINFFNDNIFKESIKITGGNMGLCNLGNTCYFDTGLQCISHCPHFVQYCLNNKFDNSDLFNALKEMFESMWIRECKSYNPSRIRYSFVRKNRKFDNFGQNDSPEMITDFLNQLSSEMSTAKSVQYSICSLDSEYEKEWKKLLNKDNSIIRNLFYGQLHHVFFCEKCNKTIMNKYEPFLFLNLTCKKEYNSNTLSKCLDDTFISKSTLKHENCEFHPRGKLKIRTKIAKMPPYLLLYFKRYYYDENASSYSYYYSYFSSRGDFQKITYYIDYDDKIDISKWLDDEVENKNSPKYVLLSVNEHHGGVGGGHYTAKVNCLNSWYYISDSYVSYESDYHSGNALALFYINENLMKNLK